MNWSDNNPMSWTTFNAFQQCPLKFYQTYIAKSIPYTPSEAQQWGNAVHNAFKRRLADNEPFPLNMAQYEFLASVLLSLPGKLLAEQGLGMARNGEPRPWSSRECYMKAKADIRVITHAQPTALLIDIKTGRVWEDPDELRFQAVVLKAHHPEIKQIKGAYLWIKESPPRIGPMYDLTDAAARLRPRVDNVMAAIDAAMLQPNPEAAFAATPGHPFPCNWCSSPTCQHAGG